MGFIEAIFFVLYTITLHVYIYYIYINNKIRIIVLVVIFYRVRNFDKIGNISLKYSYFS